MRTYKDNKNLNLWNLFYASNIEYANWDIETCDK